MKNLFLGAAALLACGAISAQDALMLNPAAAPSAQQAVTLPGTSTDNPNLTETFALGNDNRVFVRQAGQLNSTYISQTGVLSFFPGDNNQARARQHDGTGANSGVNENALEIVQRGSGNKADTYQSNDENEAVTFQRGTDNKGFIKQFGTEGYANVGQVGTGNMGYVYQGGVENAGRIMQIGTENKSQIQQVGLGNSSNEAITEQDGTANKSYIRQGFLSTSNHAQSIQDGTGNQTDIRQTRGSDNNALIVQGNIAAANAGISALPSTQAVFNDLAALYALPLGVSTPAEGAVAQQIQQGTENQVVATQFGLGGQSLQQQKGHQNVALVTQNGTDADNENKAHQQQSGTNNKMGVLQFGAGNKSYQKQWKSGTSANRDNISLVAQDGTDNLSNTFQTSYENVVHVDQYGDDNISLVSQYGCQSASVKQWGNGNWADISQSPTNYREGEDCVTPNMPDPRDPYCPPFEDIENPCSDPSAPGCGGHN